MKDALTFKPGECLFELDGRAAELQWYVDAFLVDVRDPHTQYATDLRGRRIRRWEILIVQKTRQIDEPSPQERRFYVDEAGNEIPIQTEVCRS